ncbi:MAG TPA: hypothetical protein VKS79_21275 [Gemmataceae bacterium]|nr:hypothetical protein [Gemmataceae bacterium]
MNAITITMPRDKAEALAEQYRFDLEGKADQATDVDRALLVGYEALAQGEVLLNLLQTFQTCPLDARGLPKLAIARANWKRCCYQMNFWRQRAKFMSRWEDSDCRARGIAIPRRFLPSGAKEESSFADVPTIPLSVRPRSLGGYFILWECEWQTLPGDPLLLRRLTPSLFVILAQWDLTDLERSILQGAMAE